MTDADVDPRDRWYPIARSEELVARHIVHAQLLGQELALWRDDAGRANAWENRCPHRGVRLSIGINDGVELRCRYHGWRYASGSGQCTLIPAHPSQRPASTIKARAFSVAEVHGYVWVGLGEVPAAPIDERLADRSLTTLRSLFVEAPMAAVAAALREAAAEPARVHWLQPVDDERTVIHATVLAAPPDSDRLALLRHHHASLVRVRDTAEARHRGTGD